MTAREITAAARAAADAVARGEREAFLASQSAFSMDVNDDAADMPCPECGHGPLDLKGYGMVCPNGHIIEEKN